MNKELINEISEKISEKISREVLKELTTNLLKEKNLPNTWEEVNQDNKLQDDLFKDNKYRSLKKLEILRDIYRGSWKPDWNNLSVKYCIIKLSDITITRYNSLIEPKFLSFESPQVRDLFMINFEQLIKDAGDLL